MKIVMPLMGLDIGGAETHVVELARALSRRGHEIILVSNGGAFEPELKAAGVCHVKAPLNQRDPKKMLESLAILRQVIQREKPDLVHAHARIPAFLCGILQKKMHFPLITTAHWVFTVTPLLRLMTNWGDRTVAVSEDIKTYLMENYEVPGDQIHVTINGIDTQQFSPHVDPGGLRRELGLGDGPVLGHVSRLDESRSLAAEVLLQAAPRLAEEFPKMEILLVGGGDREEFLRTQAAAVNQKAGRTVVHMTGPRTDIAQLVSLCDGFIGVSRAALEAMSGGKPVILAGNEGYMGLFGEACLAEAQETNFCLRGSPMISEDALYEDLRTLLHMTPAQRQTLGAFGRQVILDHYSVAKMTQDYLAAYDRLLRRETPPTAVISGYYGYDNLGDDAILCAIGRQLEAMETPVRLVVLSRQPKETARRFGLRAVARFSLFRVISALFRCDVLISGGGSLLQDSTSTRSLLYYLAVIRLAQRMGKPVFLYANGIGPITGEKNRRRVRRILSRCDAITLRDEDSRKELEALGVGLDRVTVTADPAFSLTPSPHGRQFLTQGGIDPNAPVVGVSVRGAAHMDRAEGEFAALCDRIHRELHREIVFVVMQEPGDGVVSQRIRDKMTEPSHVIALPNAPEAMLGVIACMDTMISMRLHTIIFAAEVRVPVVGCVYDPKVAAFLNMLGMPSCGTPENITADEAFSVTKELLARRETLRETLDEKVCLMERQARITPELLQALIRN